MRKSQLDLICQYVNANYRKHPNYIYIYKGLNQYYHLSNDIAI